MKSALQRTLLKLKNTDHKISGSLHQLDQIIVSFILYPFAAFFHPGLIWIAFLSIYYFSGYNFEFLAIYVIGVLLCLLTIFLLKKTLKR